MSIADGYFMESPLLNYLKHPPKGKYTVLIHGKRRVVEIVEFNDYTVIVRLADGHIIKRHQDKHGLRRGRRRIAR